MSISDFEHEFSLYLQSLKLPIEHEYEIFKCAMSHTSYTKEQGSSDLQSYERLEFLGDAVLKMIVSEYLYSKYPDYPEGKLSLLRAEIVSDNFIADLAKKIGLHEYIFLSKNERKTGGLNKTSIIACAFESFLGALYLSLQGGYQVVKDFYLANFSNELADVESHIDVLNPKQRLQEYTQEKSHQLPEYVVLSESGSDHNKIFEIGVYYQSELLARGFGKSKKNAQKEAAQAAIEAIQQKEGRLI